MRTFSSTVRCGNTAEIWNERTTPEPRHVGRLQRGDVLALVEDAAAGRLEELGQQVEAGGLAGAVRADQRVNGAALDAQVDAVDRDEAGEFLGQIPVSRMISALITTGKRLPETRRPYAILAMSACLAQMVKPAHEKSWAGL